MPINRFRIRSFKEVADALEQLIVTRPIKRKWDNGVREVARDIINPIVEWKGDEPFDSKSLLNGADNWLHYAESGCVLAYYHEIEDTLCSPYMRKMVSNTAGNEWTERGLRQLEHLRYKACRDAARLLERLKYK